MKTPHQLVKEFVPDEQIVSLDYHQLCGLVAMVQQDALRPFDSNEESELRLSHEVGMLKATYLPSETKGIGETLRKVERYWNKLPDLMTSQDIVKASDYDALQRELNQLKQKKGGVR